MTTIASTTLVAVIDYLLDQWATTKARTGESIRAPNIFAISLSDLESKKVEMDEARTLFSFLYEKGCFPIQRAKQFNNFKLMAGIDETEADCIAELTKGCFLGLEDINCLKLLEVKMEAEGKKGQSIIKPLALEHIARKMTERDTARNIIKMLRDCNVPYRFNISANTKGRVMIDFFCFLATSTDAVDHRLLFRILEEYCHPLHYGGDKEKAQEMQDYIADLICYDHYYFNGNTISKMGNSPDDWMIVALVNDGREKRKKEREQKSTEGLAAMAKVFDHYTQHAAQVRAEQRSAQQTPRPHDPINIVINNQNVQHPAASAVQPQATATAAPTIYALNELQIDLESRVLRNTKTDEQRDLSGFNYDFLNTLIAAKGALVSYDQIAKAAQTTVGTLSPKGIMDRKSNFIIMLQDDLHISAKTCGELIQGSGGYRVNRRIYE